MGDDFKIKYLNKKIDYNTVMCAYNYYVNEIKDYVA